MISGCSSLRIARRRKMILGCRPGFLSALMTVAPSWRAVSASAPGRSRQITETCSPVRLLWRIWLTMLRSSPPTSRVSATCATLSGRGGMAVEIGIEDVCGLVALGVERAAKGGGVRVGTLNLEQSQDDH